jgi:hypothetical protein
MRSRVNEVISATQGMAYWDFVLPWDLGVGVWDLNPSRLDYNRRTLIDHFEQFDHVLVTHPHAAVTRSRADFVLVFGPMYVDEAIARIRIVLVQSVEPQNTRRHQVLGRRPRFVGLKRNAAYKNCPFRHLASDLLRHTKTAGRRFEAPLLCPDTESRRGHRVGADRLFVFFYGELLVSN